MVVVYDYFISPSLLKAVLDRGEICCENVPFKSGNKWNSSVLIPLYCNTFKNNSFKNGNIMLCLHNIFLFLVMTHVSNIQRLYVNFSAFFFQIAERHHEHIRQAIIFLRVADCVYSNLVRVTSSCFRLTRNFICSRNWFKSLSIMKLS
jgi:hypothetical protein